MKAFELFTADGKPTGIWACGVCRRIRPAWDEERKAYVTQKVAERCCNTACDRCGKIQEKPFESWGDGLDLCESCRRTETDRRDWERRQQRLEKATDVTGSYEGIVCSDDHSRGDMCECYFTSVEAVSDSFSDRPAGMPEWVFAVREEQRTLDLGDVLERLTDDGYEDMAERLTIPPSLQAAIAEFNQVNASDLIVYQVDYSRKIRVPQPETSDGSC